MLNIVLRHEHVVPKVNSERNVFSGVDTDAGAEIGNKPIGHGEPSPTHTGVEIDLTVKQHSVEKRQLSIEWLCDDVRCDEVLHHLKLRGANIEVFERLADEVGRHVWIDPGFVEPASRVLAETRANVVDIRGRFATVRKGYAELRRAVSAGGE